MGKEEDGPSSSPPRTTSTVKGNGKREPSPSSTSTSKPTTSTAPETSESPTFHIEPNSRLQKRQRPGGKTLRTPPYTEQAATDFESGGGFSNVHPVPQYQANHTAAYFSTLAAQKISLGFEGYEGGRTDYETIGDDGKLFNLQGRGYPDLSAIGDNIYVVAGGEAVGIMGTSAATPIVASMINLINEERLAVGKGPVGWVHPVLVSDYFNLLPLLSSDHGG
jgi:hypothetical protein